MYKKAFSLIEIIVSLGIFSLLISSIASLYLSGFKYSDLIISQVDLQQQGQKSLQTMVKEIRTAIYSNQGAFPLVFANPTELVFYSNIDNDELIEQVKYFLEDQHLKKTVIKPNENFEYLEANAQTQDLIAENILNTDIFSYFNQNLEDLGGEPDISLIKLIGIKLILETDPDHYPEPLVLRTKVNLRNLKDEN